MASNTIVRNREFPCCGHSIRFTVDDEKDTTHYRACHRCGQRWVIMRDPVPVNGTRKVVRLTWYKADATQV